MCRLQHYHRIKLHIYLDIPSGVVSAASFSNSSQDVMTYCIKAKTAKRTIKSNMVKGTPIVTHKLQMN